MYECTRTPIKHFFLFNFLHELLMSLIISNGINSINKNCLPKHVNPFPVYPTLHSQSNEPSVS